MDSNVKHSFGLISRAIHLSCWQISEGIRAFQFQMSGRLGRFRKTNTLVNVYLNSIEEQTPTPYLLPVSIFFPDVDGTQTLEIHVGAHCECVVYSTCGQFIAAGAGDDAVILDANTGEVLLRVQNRATVSCVLFAEKSKQLICGLWNGKVISHSWETGEANEKVLAGHAWESEHRGEKVLPGLDKRIMNLNESHDGEGIISSAEKQTIIFRDANTWNIKKELQLGRDVHCVAMSSDDCQIAIGCRSGEVKILDGFTQNILLDGSYAHTSCVTCIGFSPNGLYLATGSMDKTIKLWNVKSYSRIGQLLQGQLVPSCVIFSPDGKQLASSSYDGIIRLWDVKRGCIIGTYPKLLEPVRSLSFHPDGKRIVSGSDDGYVRIWEAFLGNNVRRRRYENSAAVLGVSISGSKVACAMSDNRIRLLDINTGEPFGRPLEGHRDRVFCVSFSPDERRLVSGSGDLTLREWDIETHSQIGVPYRGHVYPITCVSYSCDGRRIISGSRDRTVRLWDSQTQKLIRIALEWPELAPTFVTETPDGSHVISHDSLSGTAIIWERDRNLILWQSKKGNSSGIPDKEAKRIIKSCGAESQNFWDISALEKPMGIFCDNQNVYANVQGVDHTLATFPAEVLDWKIDHARKLFVAGLPTGRVAICSIVGNTV